MPGRTRSRPGHSTTQPQPPYRKRLLDLYADAGDGVRFDHSADFLALLDHHEVQFHRGKPIPGDVYLSCSRAIRIDGICPAAERPLHWWRHSVDNDVVHLGQVTFAIKMSQRY